VNLTTRSKWLTGVAAAVAAWVLFGPKDSDFVELTGGSTHAAAHSSRATAGATAARTASRSPHTVGERVADATAAGSLFAAHSWYVAPPPPPPVVDAPPAPPPKPTAPPLPFKLIGSYTPDGEKTVFFLSAGEKVHDVHIGDTVDNTYSIDSYNNGQLVLTYKPLNQQQQLQLTGAAQ
jgi:hypothetical protein